MQLFLMLTVPGREQKSKISCFYVFGLQEGKHNEHITFDVLLVIALDPVKPLPEGREFI